MLIKTGIIYVIKNNNLWFSDTDEHLLSSLVLYIKYFSSIKKKVYCLSVSGNICFLILFRS